MLKAKNINWDTDGVAVDPPNEITIPEGMTDWDEISDFLSDETGFCHFGFDLVEEDEEPACYLVDWNNGFVGCYTADFHQKFNVKESYVFATLRDYGIRNVEIISSQELDEPRGFHKPTPEEYQEGESKSIEPPTVKIVGLEISGK